MAHLLEQKALTVNDVLLVPKKGIVDSRSDIRTEPYIWSAPMDSVTGLEMTKAMNSLGEYAVVSRFISKEERDDCMRWAIEHPSALTFFAVGFEDWQLTITRWKELGGKYSDLPLALDIAHGDMRKAHETTEAMSKFWGIKNIMSGSICTPDAALRAVENGCTHLRVGVGPGAACTTRIMTGCGYPQLSAIYMIYKALDGSDKVYIIADGGIKEPGDAVKYLAAGADGIMMGRMLSICREATGWRWEVDGQGYKTYRGQASKEFQQSRYSRSNKCPEGVSSGVIEWHGHTVQNTVEKFRGGLESACSYLGLNRQTHLKPEFVEFVEISSSGFAEGLPHV